MAIPGHLPGAGTYFVASVTSGRRRLFQVAANAKLLLETLQAYRRQGHSKLHAFVVMPDHIHLLLTPQGETIERVMGFIKGGSLTPARFEATSLAAWLLRSSHSRCRGLSDQARLHPSKSCKGRHGGFAGELPLFLRIPCRDRRTVPRRLKPLSRIGVFGTAEPVPFRSRNPSVLLTVSTCSCCRSKKAIWTALIFFGPSGLIRIARRSNNSGMLG